MAHSWKFVRVGGFDQVKLERGADLVALGELDQKLWVALACPVLGLEFDERTLALIDTDGDGRVRASELIAAAKWAGGLLTDVELLAAGPDTIPVASISEATDEGKSIRQSAVALLEDLGKPTDRLSVADAVAALAAFDAQPFNGDGVIVPASAGDDEGLQQVVTDVLACTAEPKTDRSGAPGVDAGALTAFWDALGARVAWLDAGADEAVRPLGDATADAFAALGAVRAKIDDFFGRCRVAAFDPRALQAVNRQQEEYLQIAAGDLHVSAEEIAHFPIAMVEPDRALPLAAGINPAWSDAMAGLREKVLVPLGIAGDTLDEAGWRGVCARFVAYEAWLAGEAGQAVASLGEERVRALAGSDHRAALEAAVEKDLSEKPIADAFESVERLVRYCRDLMKLANNFVSFHHFYAREGAMFQVGTLYLDQRACELCVRVNDAGRHAAMAPKSAAYLLYCDLKNAKGEKMSIVAAMTDGDVDNLMVGRNGVFYDRKGNDWDATVTKIVENPISVRQAFWSPYKRLVRAVEDMIAARAAKSEAESQAKVSAAAASTGDAASGAAVEPPKPLDVGMIAALGVAVGGITAAMGALLQAFFGLGIWMPLGVLGLIALISGPSMVVAWLKLRQRNLGPILDANGWAVNAQAKINVPLGKSLTSVAALPPGTVSDRRDPYAEKKRPVWLYVIVLALLALVVGWYVGKLDPFLPGPAKSITVLGELAPAATVEAIEKKAAEAPVEAPPAE